VKLFVFLFLCVVFLFTLQRMDSLQVPYLTRELSTAV